MSHQLTAAEAMEAADTVWLKISSWRGISLGAVHWYGKLMTGDCDREIDLKRTMTAGQARELTKIQNDNSLFGHKFTWHKGDETRCFDDQEHVIEYAISMYRQHFPGARRLVLGDPMYERFDRILHVEPQVVERKTINQLWRQNETTFSACFTCNRTIGLPFEYYAAGI